MKKNVETTKRHYCAKEIIYAVFMFSMVLFRISRHIPGAIGNVLTPITMVPALVAAVVLAVLWVCSLVKKKSA